MSEAPAEMWLRPTSLGDIGTWYQSMLEPPEPDAVRYVRADLYGAALVPPKETVFLTPAQQRVMHRALRRSLRIIEPIRNPR